MDKIRVEVLGLFRRTLPRDEAGLLSGMVLGTKGELSDEFREALRRSGVLHVVVASGFNVMLIGGIAVSLSVIWMRRKMGVILGLIMIWLYVALVGWEAPVVRAGLMGSLAFIGVIWGRVKDAGRLLVISSMGMLWWKPEWLWDVGFQLSVTATAGLIWLEPLLKADVDRDNKGDREERKIWERLMSVPVVGGSLRTTIAAQLAVWPILLGTFGEVSVWSPVVNALVLWVVPVVTMVGMVCGMAWIVLGSLGNLGIKIVLWTIWPMLKYFVMVTGFFSQLETMKWQMPWWMGVIYYIGLWWLVRRIGRSRD